MDAEDIYDSPEDKEDILTSDEVQHYMQDGDSNKRELKGSVTYEAFEIYFEKSNVSLQRAFQDYKEKRKRQISRPVDIVCDRPKSEERDIKMRSLFISQARKYIGIPYSRKSWTPEDPEFFSPLFLDCCGLVRRIMADLRSEFGFRLGPWNQGYLYDLLPVTLDSLDQVKPGDLVFTAATYFKPREKHQKHDLTHVEIFLGDGPKTIASRWRHGKVQEFDDYRFVSSVYHSPRYIFKSISTWIRGVCKNHCTEHSWVWKSELFTPTKNSIFAQN